MNILEFYKECESKYSDLKNIPDWYYKDEAEKRLQDAPLKTLSQLKKLCGENEKMMFAILQAFLLLPLSIKLHKMEASSRRKKTKEIDGKKKSLKEKIESITEKHAPNVLAFLPDTNKKALKDGARNRLRADKVFMANLEDLKDTIEKHEKENWQGKTDLHYKKIIYETFLMSKEKTDLSDHAIHELIAKLLGSLKIKNTTAKAIQHHCKTPSR